MVLKSCQLYDATLLCACPPKFQQHVLLSFFFSSHVSLTESTNAGVNLSLLSRVMSSRLARGTYNGGLLSTEAGTLARVVADGTITLAGYLGVSKLPNVTLLPSLLICISSIVGTFLTYNSMF